MKFSTIDFRAMVRLELRYGTTYRTLILQHCERLLETLQKRMSETQEQLAMAVSTDRKKDIMIDQLDKVTCSWKQYSLSNNTKKHLIRRFVLMKA